MSWLAHILGLDNASGHWYLFWSGIGSDITEFGIVVGLVALVRKHQCHVDRCWRIGRHPVGGTAYIVCRKHHPASGLSYAQVLDEHRGRR